MKIVKMYFFSACVNFIPLLVLLILYVYRHLNIFEFNDSTFLLYFLFCFFIISLFLNLSFFLLKIENFNNKKIGRFFAYYSSSIFFFIVSTYFFYAFLPYILVPLLFSAYFFTNFILALVYRQIDKSTTNNQISK